MDIVSPLKTPTYSIKNPYDMIRGLTRIAPDPSALQADFADVAAVQSWLPCFELLFIDSTPGNCLFYRSLSDIFSNFYKGRMSSLVIPVRIY